MRSLLRVPLARPAGCAGTHPGGHRSASDCDDAGALAALHALADRHEASILGIGVCTLNRWAAPTIDAIDTYYNRPDIPIGSLKDDLPEPTKISVYTEYIAKHFPNRLQDGLKAPEVVAMYRRILAAQPDHSVTFVAIGWLHNLQNLLESKADKTSALSGKELVAAKVKMLVDMGPKIDPPGIGWNFQQDPVSAVYVVQNWPTPIMFSPKEVCWAMTGSRLKEMPAANPVRKAYEIWLQARGHGGQTNHSADLTAVLYAVRGLSNYWTAPRVTCRFSRTDSASGAAARAPHQRRRKSSELLSQIDGIRRTGEAIGRVNDPTSRRREIR